MDLLKDFLRDSGFRSEWEKDFPEFDTESFLKENAERKVINIREELNRLDFDTCCKYDLINMYEALDIDDSQRKELAKYLAQGEDADFIGNYLSTMYNKRFKEDFDCDECDDKENEFEEYADNDTDFHMDILKKKSINESGIKLGKHLDELADLLTKEKEKFIDFGKRLVSGNPTSDRPYKDFTRRFAWDIYWYLKKAKGFMLDDNIDYNDDHIFSLMKAGLNKAGISINENDYRVQEESLKESKETESVKITENTQDTQKSRERRRAKITGPYNVPYTLTLKNQYNYTIVQYRIDPKNKTIEKGLFNWGDGKGSFFKNRKELQRHIDDLLSQGYKMIKSEE